MGQILTDEHAIPGADAMKSKRSRTPQRLAFALVGLAGLGLLSACSGTSVATFTCPNGPDLTVEYIDDNARLFFPDGRVEEVSANDPDRPNYYAKPGFSWSTGTREARLTDGSRSYLCDQMRG